MNLIFIRNVCISNPPLSPDLHNFTIEDLRANCLQDEGADKVVHKGPPPNWSKSLSLISSIK